MSYAHRAAVEAPREHGLVAGGMTGAWSINQQLEQIIDVVRPTGRRASAVPPDPAPTIPVMAAMTVDLQCRTFALLAELRQVLAETLQLHLL